MSKTLKIALTLLVLIVILISLPLIIYLKVIPYAVSNDKVINFVEKSVKEAAGADLKIKNPVLKTHLTPEISFKIDELALTKDKQALLTIQNLETDISLKKLFEQKIIFKKAGLDYLFADVNKLGELSSAPQEAKKSDWKVDLFESLMYIKKCLIVYKAAPDTYISVIGNNIEITDTRNPKYVRFDIAVDIRKNKDNIHLALADKDNVFIKDHKLFVQDCFLNINNSKIFINSVSDQQNRFDISVSSNNFDVKNIVKLVESNMIVPNGKEMLSFFKDINGNFNFKINMTEKGLDGTAHLNKLSFKLIPLNDLLMTMNTGDVKITKDTIYLKDFKGLYNNRQANHYEFNGSIKDYLKSFDTEIIATGDATKEFSTKHLSKIIGYPVELTGPAKTKLVYKSIYDKMDLSLMFKIDKGQDILAGGVSFSPVGYDRAVKADMHFEKNLLEIKNINYYIASEITKNSKGKIKPILTVYGNIDCDKMMKTGAMPDLKNLGFTIPKPLPSEFLNVLIGQKVFKKGTIAGHLEVDNNGKVPVLKGDLAMQKVRIPSQRLSIKDGRLTADKNHIHLNAFGRFKRSDYKFTGNILNEMIFPIIVKDVNLTVDNVDIDRMLKSFNSQQSGVDPKDAVLAAGEDENDMEAVTFNTGFLIVEKCILNVVKGEYKDIKFGNLFANLTLDKNGILEIKSNRFDFAEGISSCKVYCDLIKHKYFVRLGVKDINSDLIATTLLALKKEISGKASGLIELNTDDSLRLNGSIKFLVKNGTIGKVGLVEYALKFASLFRNPMAMISPSTLVDLVNVPEGNFDKINGHLVIKDNVVEKIMIKSSAPQLSSFIVGRFDLESRDATLRIYTKFSNKNKGFAGALRNISLNSLANRVPLSSRNDSNYYSAELNELPPIEADEKDCQVFLTKVDGDVEHFNFISSLKKIK